MWTEIKMKEDDNFSVLGQTVPKTVKKKKKSFSAVRFAHSWM